jgi:hypothetical protein
MVYFSLVLSRPFISRCYTLLKYYLPASLKRLLLLLLLLLLLCADFTQEFHAHCFFFFIFYLVCETIGTAAIPGLLCQPRVIVKMIVESRWNVDWQGKPEFSEKTCPNATFVHHKIPHAYSFICLFAS